MRKHFSFITAAFIAACAAMQPASAQNASPYWSLAGNSNTTTSSKLGTTNGVSLRMYTNNVQRMLIGYSSGNVSIGTTTLDARLTVDAASGSDVFLGKINGTVKLFGASNGGFTIGSGSKPPSNGLYVSGNTGLGTASPTNKLHVVGSGRFTTGLTVDNGGAAITNTNSNGNGLAVTGVSYGLTSTATDQYGYGISSSGYIGLYATGTNYGTYSYSSANYGTYGSTYSGKGIYGYSSSDGTGVYGYSSSGLGGDFTSYSNWGLRASTTNGTYAGVFYGSVYSSVGFTTSDRNLKQNIQEFGDAMSIINKLKPRNYEFKTDAKYAFLHLPKGNHYGLMAQDIEEILPNLVSAADHEVMKNDPPKANADGSPVRTDPSATPQKPETLTIKAVNYVELIPIMVKGMQEQAELIKQQQQQINELKDQVSRLTGSNALTSISTLNQNTPNPALATTRISYTLPDGAKAQMIFTDNSGRTIKAVPLTNAGYVNLDVSGFSSGMYHYSLLVDGKIVESKKMEVVRK